MTEGIDRKEEQGPLEGGEVVLEIYVFLLQKYIV